MPFILDALKARLHRPKKDASPDMEKALKTDLRSLTAESFEQCSERLQVLLTIRMLYDDPSRIRVLAKRDKVIQTAMLDYAQGYMLALDPVLEAAGNDSKTLAQINNRFHESTGEQLGAVRNDAARLFGEEAARLLQSMSEARTALAESIGSPGIEPATSEHEMPYVSPRPIRTLGDRLNEKQEHGLLIGDFRRLMKNVPDDFCERARTARQQQGAARIG